MDAVKAFNAELTALYDEAPPITKVKMNSISKGAMKAIKFYKHVVQSVEKFILKCKPEYKVPGLYVIDSIVRQSRHQFGADKDVFAPRFAKNITNTFINLFQCPPEEKSKIIRVLNLWQKNKVFAAEVIQPLFDLADPNHHAYKELAASGSNGDMIKSSPAVKGPMKHDGEPSNDPQTKPNNLQQQLQQIHQLLLRQPEYSKSLLQSRKPDVKFDKKLLDYDYSEEDDDSQNPSPNQDLLGRFLQSNPDVLRRLQAQLNPIASQTQAELEEKRKQLEMEMKKEEEFDKHLAHLAPSLPFAAECDLSVTEGDVSAYSFMSSQTEMSQAPPGFTQMESIPVADDTNGSDVEFIGSEPNNVVINLDGNDSATRSPVDKHRRRRSTSRDRRRRSRSRSRGRRRRSRNRSRSRSRDRRDRDRDRDKNRDRDADKEQEHERERKKRGLPPIKPEYLSVCSTTLWVGHLSKLVHQEDLSDTFGEYGDVVSIDLISPRGCAFIVMNRRQDAYRCLTKLKHHVMHGKAITIAWAPGKGMKGKEWKDYWEVELGVSYIPWSKLKPPINVEVLEEGGMIDEDTMPQWLKEQCQSENNSQPTSENSKADISYIQVPSGMPLGPAGPVLDTSQPPPTAHPMLPIPPTHMPVPPFPMPPVPRLLGPMGMMPPNMGMPLAVPPPNLMGLSAFPQASSGLVNSIPLPSTPAQDKGNMPQLGAQVPPLAMVPPTSEATLPGMSEALLRVPFGVPPHIQAALVQQHAMRQANIAAKTQLHQSNNSPIIPTSGPSSANHHDDNMDIDMDDDMAKINDKPNSSSDQLLASFRAEHHLAQFSFPPPPPVHSIDNNQEKIKSNYDKKHDERGRGRDKDRSRDRDRDRDRDRGNERDRDVDRRSGRWHDDDIKRGNYDNDKPEKSLQDRLRDLAKESPIKNQDRDDRFERRDRDRRRTDDVVSHFNANNRNMNVPGNVVSQPVEPQHFSDMSKKGPPLLRDPLPFPDIRDGVRAQFGDRDLRQPFPDGMRDARQYGENCRDNVREHRMPFQDGFDNRDRRSFVDREPGPLFPNDMMEHALPFNERENNFRDIDARHAGLHFGDNLRDNMNKSVPPFPEMLDAFDYPDDMMAPHSRMRPDEMDMYEYEMRREEYLLERLNGNVPPMRDDFDPRMHGGPEFFGGPRNFNNSMGPRGHALMMNRPQMPPPPFGPRRGLPPLMRGGPPRGMRMNGPPRALFMNNIRPGFDMGQRPQFYGCDMPLHPEHGFDMDERAGGQRRPDKRSRSQNDESEKIKPNENRRNSRWNNSPDNKTENKTEEESSPSNEKNDTNAHSSEISQENDMPSDQDMCNKSEENSIENTAPTNVDAELESNKEQNESVSCENSSECSNDKKLNTGGGDTPLHDEPGEQD